MQKGFSLYLDLVRLFAAFLVFLFHSKRVYDPHFVLFDLGHEAVVIFFVLSGFVIAHVSSTKETDFKRYAISRMTRIYSVAIPAILITAITDTAGWRIDPSVYPPGYQAWDAPLLRVGGALLFMNEIWGAGIQLFSNVPYWSLNYQVWYYIGFACLAFVGGKKRWWLFAAVCVFVGPKILLLMPLWWLGVWIYRSRALNALSQRGGAALVALSVLGMFVYLHFDLAKWVANDLELWLGPRLYRELSFSKTFLNDYYLGAVVAAHFVGMRALSDPLAWVLGRIDRPIRYFASFTFSLYLIHQPVLLFFHAVIHGQPSNVWAYPVILASTLGATLCLGALTERKKDFWRKWIAIAWNRIEFAVDGRFGTFRGLARTALADIMWRAGPYRKFGRVDWQRVKRLVFICHGNICRSPFAEAMAAKHLPNFPAKSIGLSTTTGAASFAQAQDVARGYAVDLSTHRATDVRDFEFRDGDLLLAMEDRHIAKLRSHLTGQDVQVGLLGLWCRPRFALLYDPYRLSTDYIATCFDRIERAVIRLAREANSYDVDHSCRWRPRFWSARTTERGHGAT